MTEPRYPVEVLNEDEDNGTMPGNVDTLRDAVIGRRIVSAERGSISSKRRYESRPYERQGFVLTLDDGRQVGMFDDSDCCAYTELASFLLHPDKVDHVITGVGTSDGYTKWHIFAAAGDILDLNVAWSAGNAFYYGYGFDIAVVDPAVSAAA